jgi:hypothetical protein
MTTGTPLTRVGMGPDQQHREHVMTDRLSDRLTDPSRQDLNHRLMIAALATLGVASVLGLGGSALVVAAITGAGRRGHHRPELPPAQLAMLKSDRSRAAASAGA